MKQLINRSNLPFNWWVILAIATICYALLTCCSCRSKQVVVGKRDSVRVETKYREVLKTDTVRIEIPLQRAERNTLGKVSKLENDFAFSNAWINPDGSLHHDLSTKPQMKPVHVQTKTIYKDSIAYVDKEVSKPVYIEKKLSWWQKTSIDYFGWMVSICLALLTWILRKPILLVFNKIIRK